MSKNQASTSTSHGLSLEQWLLLLIALSAPFLAVLDTFIFNVALPSIQRGFQASDAAVQMVVVGYTLPYASLLVTGGRLGDIYGRKRLFLWGMASFCAASFLGAMAPNAGALIAVRVAQGAAAALMYPQALSIIQVAFSEAQRKVALGAFGVVLGLASIVGQLAGGLLVQLNIWGLSWRPIFLINIPLGAIVVLLALRYMQESRDAAEARLDMGGVLLLTMALVPFVFFVVMGRQLGWPIWVWALLPVALGAGAWFVAYERILTARAQAPLFDLGLLRSKSLVLGLCITFIFYAGQVSFFFLLTLYLQRGLQLSSLAAGLTFVPVAVGFFTASMLSPSLVSKLGKQVLMLGAIVSTVSIMVLSVLSPQASTHQIALLAILLFVGLGFGLIIPPLIGVVLRGVPKAHAGSASGALVTIQQVAGGVGIAAAGIPFFGMAGRFHDNYVSAFGRTLYCTAGVFVITALLVAVLREQRSETRMRSYANNAG